MHSKLLLMFYINSFIMKKKQPKLVLLKEAEERLGISRQTLTNWMDAGFLDGMRSGNYIWLIEGQIAQIEKPAKIKIKNIKKMAKDISNIENELKARIKSLDKQFADIGKSEMLIGKCTDSTLASKTVEMLIDTFVDEPDERDSKIFRSVILNGHTRSEVAEEFSVKEYTVVAAVEKTLSRIRHNANTALGHSFEYTEMKKTVEELKDRLKVLSKAYKDVQDENIRLTEKFGEISDIKSLNRGRIVSMADASANDEETVKMIETMRIPLTTMNFSVGTMNVLIGNGLQTVGDLVRKTPTDILSMRQAGRKKLSEIEEKLEPMGLKLGMDISRYFVTGANAVILDNIQA